MFEPAARLFDVVEPVAERPVIVAAIPEPAVVENEKLDARLFRSARDVEDLFFVEIEIRPLPVVHENGALLFLPFAAHDVFADERVHFVGNAVLVGRVTHHRFGRVELFAGCERPAEHEIVDARQNSRPARFARFEYFFMIARIDEIERVNAVLPFRHDEGVAIVRGRPFFGIVVKHALAHRAGNFLAFARPSAFERDEGIIPQKVELQARKATDMQLLFGCVDEF